ncbi:MAG: NAD(P)-dependent glycerol-3-phosphate dehydrogenase [Veillonellaceae bacterium]|nr:NAD(P)-dependent glycerol-3-phosphate dehydrogenase [Veillonellaceae bacterium]
MKIVMLGSGSWGTAMTSQLAQKHADITLYSRNAEVVETIRATGENSAYLPGVSIPAHVKLSNDLEAAVHGAEVVVLATPAKAIAETAASVREWLAPQALVISTAKGLSATGRRLSEEIRDALGDKTEHIAVLSGPNHAEEVGRGQPAATVVAAASKETAMRAQEVYMMPRLRAYYSTDLLGVEYGGALKNIIALAAGVVDGLAYGDNTQAALITRGLTEIARYACACGAKRETLFGLAGMGDLIVTCTSSHSRNHTAGLLLAQGKTAAEIVAGTRMVVEGIRTTGIVYPLARERGIEMPITEQVYLLLEGKIRATESLRILMEREKKHELQEPTW